MKKLTKKEVFGLLLELEEVSSSPVFVEFIEHEIELLSKVRSGSGKPSKTQLENNGIKEIIVTHFLENGDCLLTVTELIKSNELLSDYTNQKISAIMKQMVEEGLLTRIPLGRKTVFRLA